MRVPIAVALLTLLPLVPTAVAEPICEGDICVHLDDPRACEPQSGTAKTGVSTGSSSGAYYECAQPHSDCYYRWVNVQPEYYTVVAWAVFECPSYEYRFCWLIINGGIYGCPANLPPPAP